MRVTASQPPIRRSGRYTVIRPPTEIDASNSDQVRAQLLGLLNTESTAPLIVDLTGTEFCDSSGIRALIRAHTRATGSGRRLYVAVSPTGMVRKIFDVTAISRLIPSYDDVETAIAAAVVGQGASGTGP